MANNRNEFTIRAKRFFEIFSEVNKFILDELGEKPFSPNGPLNVAVLDAIFVAVAASWPKKPKEFKFKTRKLIASAKFVNLYSARTADTEIVRSRLKLAAETLA